VVAAKFLTAAGLGALISAASFGTALTIAAPLYASKGVHQLPVDLARLWIGTTIVSACYGMLGVALGALARNTVGAIIGAFVWIQVIEVGVLQPALPSLAKWLPTGAAVALTSVGTSAQHLLSTGPAALTLIAWAVLLTAIAAKTSITRELT
jgi:ABC-2 type transport system permease protein